jgi:hypothetical protein
MPDKNIFRSKVKTQLMKIRNEELAALEKQTKSLWKSIYSRDFLRLNNPKELEYLMSGHATELVQKIMIRYPHNDLHSAHIYGVQAADRTSNRYCWVYVYYNSKLWKVWSLVEAFDLVSKLRQHAELEDKEEKLAQKIDIQAKVLTASKN